MPFDVAPPEVRETEDQRILREAARLVRRGWCQREMFQNGRKYCAAGAVIGAIERTWGGQGRKSTYYSKLIRLCGQHLGQGLPSWNDTPGRTAEEVATMFEAVADGMG